VSPHPNHLDAIEGRLAQGLGQALSLFIFVYDGDICADKTKRLAINEKPGPVSGHKTSAYSYRAFRL
jgi:hypothetical protein